MYYIAYLLCCIINVVMLRKFTTLSLSDWEMWAWFAVPIISYLAGIDAGIRSKH